MESDNPYRAPDEIRPLAAPDPGTLPMGAVADALRLIDSARPAAVFGIIPGLMLLSTCLVFSTIIAVELLYLPRLISWYALRHRYPDLVDDDGDGPPGLAHDYRAALPRLWFTVVFWPGLLFGIIVSTQIVA